MLADTSALANTGVRSPQARLNALAIVDYANGTRAYFFVPGDASAHLDLQLAHDRQERGEIPPGEIRAVARSR